MFQTLRNAWKIEDLRKKLLFTLLILVIVRLGCAIPVPFLDPSRITLYYGVHCHSAAYRCYSLPGADGKGRP